MKKIFLVLSAVVLAFSVLYAQDEATTGQTETENTSSTNESDDTQKDTISELQFFSPSFTDLRNTDEGNLDKEFQLLQTNLIKLKDDYLFRIAYKANKILENYTNVNYTDTNQLFFNAFRYYDLIAGPIATDNNVDIALYEVQKSMNLYKSFEPTYLALGKTNELAQVTYELNLYAGLLNMFKGTSSYYTKAVKYLNDALAYEEATTKDTDRLITLNTYLAGINYRLATKNQPSDVNKVYYLNQMFNNLWDLTTLKNSDEATRDAKYKLLLTQYHKVLSVNTERFKTTYQKYYDELGFTYGDTESEILSREEKPEYKESSANNTETTTTETTTTTEQ